MSQSKFFNLRSKRDSSPRNRRALVSSLLHAFAALGLLAMGAAMGAAQHTVVEKNGVGGKIETDYNAADKASEMRTIGADGKLQQKVDYEYLPGYHVPQQTDTTYWPSGRVRKVARNSYDASANFTEEFIQVFDESGKQIGGHRLTHDPWTGTYRCAEWNAAAEDYRAVACPSGEEGGGGEAEEPKKFTYDEVIKHLDAARKNAQREQQNTGRARAEESPAAKERMVGMVLPAQVHPGERVSGTVVENPDRYSEMPEVAVTRIAVPFEATGEASGLSGWRFETEGEEARPADGPITFVVPRRGSKLKITFRQAGNQDRSVTQTLDLSANFGRPTQEARGANSFHVAALCLKGELCAVSGSFGGDSRKTFAAFEDRPATIVAENSETAYLSIPELTEPGARPLFLSETSADGAKVVAFPVVVGMFFIRNIGREVQAGESLITFPTLDGPGDLPDSAWLAGNFPATNLERAQQLIPGFQLPKASREAHEEGESKEKRKIEENPAEGNPKEEQKEEGEILLIVKNVMPDQISLRSSKNEMLVFHLSDESFRRGEFKYDLLIEAKKAGKVQVKGYVIPFLAPIAGQEFNAKVAH
jgi:hypothetical protein